jgi:hypothetical protein
MEDAHGRMNEAKMTKHGAMTNSLLGVHVHSALSEPLGLLCFGIRIKFWILER